MQCWCCPRNGRGRSGPMWSLGGLEFAGLSSLIELVPWRRKVCVQGCSNRMARR